MNRWTATIESIEAEEGLVRASCMAGDRILSVLLVDDGARWIAAGREVHLLFKETEVVLAPCGRAPWPGAFPAQASTVRPGAVVTEASFEGPGGSFSVLLDSRTAQALSLRDGTVLDAWLPPSSIAMEEPA
jgi:hypothetical protein